MAWVCALYLALKLGDITLSGGLAALLALDQPSLLMVLELGLGVVLPIVLVAWPITRRYRFGPLAAPLLVLLGVLLNRFNATMFAQKLPEGVTYAPHLLEWLSTFGILAAAALVWWLGIRTLAIFDAHEEAQEAEGSTTARQETATSH